MKNKKMHQIICLVLVLLMASLMFSGSAEAAGNNTPHKIEFCVKNERQNDIQVYSTVDGKKARDGFRVFAGDEECHVSDDKYPQGNHIASIKWEEKNSIVKGELSQGVYVGSEQAQVDFKVKLDDTRGTLEYTIKKPTENKDHRYQTYLVVNGEDIATPLNPDDREVTKTKKLDAGDYKVKLKWENRITKIDGEQTYGTITIKSGDIKKITITIDDSSRENSAPGFNNPGPLSGEVGKQISFTVIGTDIDGDKVTFKSYSKECSVSTIDSKGYVFCTFNSEGNYKIQFEAFDTKNNGYVDNIEFNIKKPTPSKNPRILEAKWSRSQANIGDIVDLNVKTADIEDNTQIAFDIHEKNGADWIFEEGVKIGKVVNNQFTAKWTANVLGSQFVDPEFYFKAKINGVNSLDSSSLKILSRQDVIEVKNLENVLASSPILIIPPKQMSSVLSKEVDRLKTELIKKYPLGAIVDNPSITGNIITDKNIGDKNLIIVDAQNNEFYNKYISDKLKPQRSIKITTNPVNKRQYSIVLGDGVDSVAGFRLTVESMASKKIGLKDGFISCFYTDENTPASLFGVNFVCNIIPIIELIPDTVQTAECLANTNKNIWDEILCHLTYVGDAIDVNSNAVLIGSIFTGPGILAGIGAEAAIDATVDSGITSLKVLAKTLKKSGKLSIDYANSVLKFIKSFDNLKLLATIGSKIEKLKLGEEAFIDLLAIVAKNPETVMSVLKSMSKIQDISGNVAKDIIKLGKLATELKVVVKFDEISTQFVPKIINLLEDTKNGKFAEKLERGIKDYSLGSELKEIKFVDVIDGNPSVTAGIEVTKELPLIGKPTGRLFIKADINDIADVKDRVLIHELSHLKVDTILYKVASKVDKFVPDILPLSLTEGKFKQFGEYLADSLYKVGKINAADAKIYESQVKTLLKNTNHDTLGKAFILFADKGEDATSTGLSTLQAVRNAALAEKIGFTEYAENIREAIRANIKTTYPSKEAEFLKKFDDMMKSFQKLGDETSESLLSDSVERLSKSELDNMVSKTGKRIDEFIKGNGILPEPILSNPGKIDSSIPIIIVPPQINLSSTPPINSGIKTCGGIAGLKCPTGYSCVIEGSIYPDKSGICVLDASPKPTPAPTSQPSKQPSPLPTITPTPTIKPKLPEPQKPTPITTILPTPQPTQTPVPVKTLEDYPEKWLSGHVSSSLGKESVNFKDGKLWLTAGWSTTAMSVYKENYTNVEVEADLTGVSTSYMSDLLQPGIVLRGSEPITKRTTGFVSKPRDIQFMSMTSDGQIKYKTVTIAEYVYATTESNTIDSSIIVKLNTRGDTVDVGYSLGLQSGGGYSAKFNSEVGKTYHMKIRLVENIISVWVDGKLVIDQYKLEDGKYPKSGLIGFSSQGSETSSFDNLVITNLPSPIPNTEILRIPVPPQSSRQSRELIMISSLQNNPLSQPLVTEGAPVTATAVQDGRLKIYTNSNLKLGEFDVKKNDIIKLYRDVLPNGRPWTINVFVNNNQVYRNSRLGSPAMRA